MATPGFHAEAAITVARTVGARYLRRAILDETTLAPASEPWPVPWGVDEAGNLVWKLWQFFPPEPPPPPPPAAGYTLGLGGTIAVALAAIAAGTAIGAGTGLGIEAAITEDETPAGSLDPACTNAPGPRTRRSLFKTYWGCERSLTKTINEAHAICGRRQRCVGGCTNGSTCIATATIDSVVQTIGFTGCETALYYTCDCGC